MSSKRSRDARERAVPALDENQVAAWLAVNAEFLERHPDVLESLNVPHKAGKAVSLIERQVEKIRDRNRLLQTRLKTLLDTARENEARILHLQDLARALIISRNMQEVFRALENSLIRDFSVDAIFLGVRTDAARGSDIKGLQYLSPEHPVMEGFRDLFRQARTVCGPLTERQYEILFPDDDGLLKSAAVVPIGRPATLGMMVVASREPRRFRPEIGTLFLEMIADLVASAVLVHREQP